MAVPRDHRWQTKFGKWVHQFGAARLAAELGVTKGAIYYWLRLRGRVVYPDPEHAMQIVALSCGALTLDSIYTHRREASLILSGIREAPCYKPDTKQCASAIP